MGTSFSHLTAISCSLHILHWKDIYNFIYPHSASCPKFMLISSSAVTTFLAPVHPGISHSLLYSNCRKPCFLPSHIGGYWQVVAGSCLLPMWWMLSFALKYQSETAPIFHRQSPVLGVKQGHFPTPQSSHRKAAVSHSVPFWLSPQVDL